MTLLQLGHILKYYLETIEDDILTCYKVGKCENMLSKRNKTQNIRYYMILPMWSI